MPTAALFDIHANLPALDAVLAEIARTNVDRIVVGGDAVLGPMPLETMQRLLELDLPVYFIHGNCELAVLAQMAAPSSDAATYWGTTSGDPLPEPLREGFRWVAQQLKSEYELLLSTWPRTVRLEVAGLGPVLFCHATPRSEVEIFTRETPEDRLRPVFDPLGVPLVVCGHTHMQFDRRVGATRIVNAGSVGAPFGKQGAHWALLGPGVEFRCTPYDFAAAAELLRASAYPRADEAADGVIRPPSEDEMLALFEPAAMK